MCANDADMPSFKSKSICVVKSKVKGRPNKSSEQQHNNNNKNYSLSRCRTQAKNIM